jgi:hypothetical protein
MTTMERPGAGIATVKGDGGSADVSDEDLQAFKAEAKQIAEGAAYNVNERRFASEETRFCIWEGQSPDGRKHAEANDGRPAFPFEGASDARIRLADMIVNERVLLLMAAAVRQTPRVKGLDINNEALGHKLTTLLNWVIQNKLGSEYVRTILKLANYQEGDSPSGAMLGIWWEQETALEMRTLTVEQLRGLLVQTFGLPPDRVAALEAQLMDPDQDQASAEALQELAPHLTPKRARQVVKELRAEGAAQFPAPYLRRDQPVLCAYRVFEHIFFPTNTAATQTGRCFFIREWLNEVQVREREHSEGYAKEFIDGVLEHEGDTGWPVYRRNPTQGDFMVIKQEESKEAYRGLYEVNTVFFRAVNDEGIPGLYYLPYHTAVDVPAHERRLLEYQHGEYPLVYFSREVLGERLLDSRGVPEVVATEQQALKLLADSFNDNVTISTLPNILVPRRRSKLSLVIGPLKIIKEDRPGDVRWMEPPQYPIGNDKQQEEVRRRVNEYFGRMAEGVLPTLVQLHQTGMTMVFLASLGDALTQVLQLCQQYMDEDELALITGDDGIPIARSREEIQGKFRVELSFDPRDLDMEYLKELVGIVMQILQADTLNTVQRDKLVQRLFMAIDPQLAVGTLRSVDDANEGEKKDEEDNFAKISAGVEPEMVAEGQNFQLRLQVLQGIGQKNQEALQKLSPMSRQIYDARLKYLANQVQQMRNAQIGRQVGQPALGPGGAAGQGMTAGMSAGAGMGAMGNGMGMNGQ